MERLVDITPAWDRRHPDAAKSYGVKGCTLRMVLKGELGATQFILYTAWHLPHVTEERLDDPRDDRMWREITWLPLPADVGYHSPHPMREGQEPLTHECDVLGGTCYYDGSSLAANGVYKIMLSEGSDGVWRELEERYVELFGELR